MISVGLGQLCVTRAASSLVVSSSLLPSPFPAASVSIRPPSPSSLTLLRSQSSPRSHQLPQNPDDDDAQLEDLRVPLHWLLPPNAFQVRDYTKPKCEREPIPHGCIVIGIISGAPCKKSEIYNFRGTHPSCYSLPFWAISFQVSTCACNLYLRI
ncbi:uncharacterized protein LOC114759215 isoform X3 [Neltuma alba]|uniref:uncharacterized protein LOC114759215 isoform X3 n=1 Tax=Neltuma alba TaxID=207710 RepID=UPI0010A58D92|nr:uncharacterized protein LOC114759215 isoform X3 [Prosopis alba]